jgi:hypothetical protein
VKQAAVCSHWTGWRRPSSRRRCAGSCGHGLPHPSDPRPVADAFSHLRRRPSVRPRSENYYSHRLWCSKKSATSSAVSASRHPGPTAWPESWPRMNRNWLRLPSRMPARPAAGNPREHGEQPHSRHALLVARQPLKCKPCRYFCDGTMAATASISTIYSGAASLLTSTSVLAGGASALMYCARTARTSSALDMSVR